MNDLHLRKQSQSKIMTNLKKCRINSLNNNMLKKLTSKKRRRIEKINLKKNSYMLRDNLNFIFGNSNYHLINRWHFTVDAKF